MANLGLAAFAADLARHVHETADIAGQQKIALPADTSIEGSVGIGQIPAGFGIEVELKIHVPGLPREQVEALVQKAHQVCPYSNATRGNIDVKLTVA